MVLINYKFNKDCIFYFIETKMNYFVEINQSFNIAI